MHLDWSVNEYYLTWLYSFHFPNKKNSGSTKYFNYTVHTESATHSGVCFVLQKKPTMDTLGQQHSPLRIQRYSISTKYEWEDTVINKNILLSPTAVNFEYNNQESNTLSIGPISEVAPGQLVLVKGHMEHVSATKTVVLQSNPVKKQEAFINDPFGYARLVLWGNHNDTLTEGSTYLLDKVWVKVINEERYLNTPKNENESTISSVAKFAETLHPVQKHFHFKGHHSKHHWADKHEQLPYLLIWQQKCHHKRKIAICTNCTMSMKITSCNQHWFLKIYLQDSNHSRNND